MYPKTIRKNSFIKDHPDFIKVIIAHLLSQSGSYLLTIAFATNIYLKTGSPVYASFIFVASYLPSALMGKKTRSLTDKYFSKNSLIFLEIFLAVISVLSCVFLILDYIILLFIILVIRSVVMLISKSQQNKLLKYIKPYKNLAATLEYFLLSFLLGTMLAGVIAGVVFDSNLENTIELILYIDLASFVLSIILFSSLDLNIKKYQDNKKARSIDHNNKNIIALGLLITILVGIFQGSYQALISYLPAKFLLSGSTLSSFQVAASSGLIFGYFINRSLRFIRVKLKFLFHGLYLIGVIAAMSNYYLENSSLSLLAMFVMCSVFELLWLNFRVKYFLSIPKENLAAWQFRLSATSGLVLSLSTLGFSFSIHHLSILKSMMLIFLTIGMICLSRTLKLNV